MYLIGVSLGMLGALVDTKTSRKRAALRKEELGTMLWRGGRETSVDIAFSCRGGEMPMTFCRVELKKGTRNAKRFGNYP